MTIFWHLGDIQIPEFYNSFKDACWPVQKKDVLIHNPNTINSLFMSSSTKEEQFSCYYIFSLPSSKTSWPFYPWPNYTRQTDIIFPVVYLSPSIEQREWVIINVRMENRSYIKETNWRVVIGFIKTFI